MSASLIQTQAAKPYTCGWYVMHYAHTKPAFAGTQCANAGMDGYI